MKSLTRKEELIMLSILNLKKNAYLVAIADHLSQTTGKKVSLTSVHLPLNRLEKKGLIESSLERRRQSEEDGGKRSTPSPSWVLNRWKNTRESQTSSGKNT